ncbi:MAG TPA: M28 family peptidase, partial [Polyangiaceae bacterium]
MASRLLRAGLAGILACACAPRASCPAKVAIPEAGPVPAAPAGPAPLSPATPEERDLAERLRATVTHLAGEIGERNVGRSWNMASATDDLARTLEKMGYEVHRQGIVIGDDVVQNLDVRAGGGAHGGEAIVVCAHFDSAAGSPGADDNASGAAAIVELARLLREKKTDRSVRLALLANGEAPYFGTDHMGSVVYAKGLVAEGVHVIGMMSLDGIGVYRGPPAAGSPPRDVALPPGDDFIAVLGNEPSRAFFTDVAAGMRAHATMPVATAVLDEKSPLVADSDQWAFWKLGLPAVVITDTGPVRYAHHHAKADVTAELDFA